VQAAIGSHIISRETIKALRKRRAREMLRAATSRARRRLLEKQKAGKRPHEAGRHRGDSAGGFLAILQ
jgi:GTP-binding protein LepA